MGYSTNVYLQPYVICKNTKNVDKWEVENAIKEHLFCVPPNAEPYIEGYHVWVSNVKDGNDLSFKIEPGCNILIPLKGFSTADSIDDFRGFFKKEIEILDEFYGHENVRFGFGLMQMVW